MAMVQCTCKTWVKEEQETEKHFQPSKMKVQHKGHKLDEWDAANSTFRGKLTALKVYRRKGETRRIKKRKFLP